MNTNTLSVAEREIIAKWKKDYSYPDTVIAIRRGDRSREYPVTTTEWATATK